MAEEQNQAEENKDLRGMIAQAVDTQVDERSATNELVDKIVADRVDAKMERRGELLHYAIGEQERLAKALTDAETPAVVGRKANGEKVLQDVWTECQWRKIATLRANYAEITEVIDAMNFNRMSHISRKGYKEVKFED